MAMANPVTESRPTSSIASPRHVRSRTQSISSDRPSTISHGLLLPPLSVSPEAAFIAAAAASQIVTTDHDKHANTWYDQNGIEPSGETALVSPAALQLVNGFLDQLLFSFLQVAKSTSLAALRPAITQVLKPKLANDTIHNADEELREYVGGDEEIYAEPRNARDWDVELVWKRARLRCMVYSSLGDLEEEDEDMYMEQENLEIGAHEQLSDIISPTVGIFLASVLEYMGELTLTVAGQAAYHRVQAKMEKEIKEGTRSLDDLADQIIVDEMDMERVALDRTLGRLWRGWKKRMRPPVIDSLGRALSVSRPRHDIHAAEPYTPRTPASDAGKPQDHIEDPIAEDVDPMNIPLPMGDNDIEEIEVPGLARHSDDEDEDEDEEDKRQTRRPKSFVVGSAAANGQRTPAPVWRHTVLTLHKRSNSLPTPKRSVFYATARPSTRSGTTATSVDSSDVEDGSAKQSPEEAEIAEIEETAQTKKTPPKPTLVTNGRLTKVRGKDGSVWDADDVDDVATYEKAEILTSSRVSVSSSSSRSVSDSGRAIHVRRSSSVHSARIIDVPAPRSPVASHSPSPDAAERPRPVSLSSSSPLVQSFSADESRKMKAIDHGTRAAAGVSSTRSPVDRMKPSLQNAATISESEEEVDERSVKTSGAAHAAPSTRSKDQGHIVHALQTNFRQTDRISPSPKVEQAPSSTKVTILNKVSSFVEEQQPEIPRKSTGHSNWQTPKNEGKGMAAVERTRSKETEEEVAPPLHSIVPPRQIHTSGSSGSSATGRLKALRTSEDSSSRAESVARNFEELIQSNQTITYTLTPENMRDIDVKSSLESPVVTKFARKSEEIRGPSSETNGSPLGQRATPAVPQIPAENKSSQPTTGSIPRAPTGVAIASGRVGGPQAREARVHGESIADFAEFIKSTGPSGDRGPLSLRSAQVSNSPAKRSIDSRRVSITSNYSNQSSNRYRYQPRDARPDQKADNSDLIDFIRQGPPVSSSGQHRIPRHVAPFRNTMDSDIMSGAVGGKAVDAVIPEIRYSQTSTNFTETPSMQSSINSNSALLRNGDASKIRKILGEEEGMPVRKTRRVRDPYAVDFSDEEEDDDLTPRAPVKKEESLAEFLRNYEPPPQPPSPPKKVPKKKSSAPSLMGRLTRGSSKDANGASATEARSLNSRTSNKPFAVNETRSLNSRIGTKHIPIQVNLPPGYDMYGPVDDKSPRPRMGSTTGSMGRVPMKKFEPREAVALGQTSDLAAFLRDSEPPPTPTSTRQDDANGFSKMFNRRRKASIA